MGTFLKIGILRKQTPHINNKMNELKKIQKLKYQLLHLAALLLLANIASSQEIKTVAIGIGVHAQPLPVMSKIQLPFFNTISLENPEAQSLLLRPKETVYGIEANWSVSYLRKQKMNKGKQRLLAAPFHLLGYGLGKEEVIKRNRERRQYPDFVKF